MMPSGRIHEAVNVLALPGALWFLPESFSKAGFVIGYLVGTFWVTPDLDLTKSRPMRRWGRLRLLWLPYAWFFRHRGLSHRLILGALTRLLYLAVAASFGLLALHWLGFRWSLPPLIIAREAISFFAGLVAADTLHILLDTLFTRRRSLTH